MRLRPYEIEDAPILAETYNDPAYSEYWRNFNGFFKSTDFENIEQLLGMQIGVVEEDNTVIGFLMGQPRTNTTICVSIIILSKFQGKGYFEKFIETGLKYLKGQRFHKMVTMVNPKNDLVIKLCKSLGFIEEGFFKEERWSADGWKDELVMAMLI